MWRSLTRLADELQTHFRPVDLLDILVVAALLYVLLVWLARRGSRGMLAAATLALVLFTVARLLGLYMTSWLFQAGFAVVLLSLVLIFQADLRRAFERLAAWSLHRKSTGSDVAQTIDTLIESAVHLAERRDGALIVLKGREPLGLHLRGGIPLQGILSLPLLSSLFDSHSPGHDGAVVVHHGQIDEFGAHLPLSTNLAEIGARGTRHTAALGLAERTDALVIVVSEERGTISLAHEGRLIETESAAELRNRLEVYFERLYPGAEVKPWGRLFQNPGLKLTAALLACAAWILFVLPRDTRTQTYAEIPIAFQNLPPGWRVLDYGPTELQVTVTGAARDFRIVDPQQLVATLDLSSPRSGVQYVPLTAEHLNLPDEMEVTRLEPREVRLEAWPMRRAQLRVRVPQTGRLPEGLTLTAIRVAPATVDVLVRRRDIGAITEIQTEPIDLGRIRGDTAVAANLVLPENTLLPEDAAGSVQVVVDVTPQASDD